MEQQLIQERVARGVALLNITRPGWEDRIVLEYLGMASCNHCILGQLYGEYGYGLDRLDIDGGISYGFSLCHTDSIIPGWNYLRQEWECQILALREEKRTRAEVEELAEEPELVGVE